MNITAIVMLAVAIAAVADNDSISDVQLGEVEVSTSRVVEKGDHVNLYMSDRNRKFGTNALDAVSTLPMFQSGLNATKLTSTERQEVYVLINGVPSTAIDLRSLKSDEIRYVEYYSVTPAKYLMFTQGPVANIITRTPRDYYGAIYANAVNSVTTGYGTDQLSVTLADSLNRIKATYFCDYRRLSHGVRTSVYDYGSNGKSRAESNGDTYSGAYQYIQGAWQRYDGKDMLNIDVKYGWNPSRERHNMTLTSDYDGMKLEGYSSQYMRNGSKSGTADIYYSHSFGMKGVLSANVVNYLAKSYSSSTLSQGYASEEDNAFAVNDRVDNTTYGLVAALSYMRPWLGATFIGGGQFNYRRLSQRYGVTRETPALADGFVYAAMVWNRNGMTFYPTLGLSVSGRKSTGRSDTYVLPYGRIYADWWGKDRLRGCTVQLTATVDNNPPTTGQLTESVTTIDRGFVSTGNPGLEAYWRASLKTVLGYYAPDGSKQFSIIYTPRYLHRPFAPVLYATDGVMVKRPEQLRDNVTQYLDMNVKWSVTDWLELAPYCELRTTRYTTPMRKVRWHYWRAGGTVSVSAGNFDGEINLNSPVRSVGGDLEAFECQQYSVILMYKYRAWSFGAEWHYSGYSWQGGSCEGFSYRIGDNWKRLRTNVMLTTTWSFSKGKSRRPGQKLLNLNVSDDGLVNDNRVKKY